MSVKNIYGIKKDTGETLSITDLSDSENGAKCNCECPYCHTDFIARKLGKKNAPHFAHSGEGCDIEKANMNGLFMLIRDYLMSGGEICYPAAEWKCDDPVYFPYPFIVPITEQDFDKRVKLKIDTCNPKKCNFLSVEIVQSQNEYPVAMLCKKGDYTLALRVVPPATICKTATRTAYEHFPTLLLDLSKKTFADLSRKEIGFVLNDISLFSWKQYVPISQERREKIIEKSAVLCEQEKQKRKEHAPKKQATIYSESPSAIKPISPAVLRPIPARTPFLPYGETVRLATEDMTYQRIADEPKVVLDAHTGIRVGVCQVCKRTKSKDAFAVLPVYSNQKNVGICAMCAEKNFHK